MNVNFPVSDMDFRWSICQNVDQILKLIWHFKRLEIAAKICHQLNIHNGVIEHFGTNYSRVYCIWPKIFPEMNYCIAGSNPSLGRVDFLDKCSEIEVLEKLKQELLKRSVEIIFKNNDKYHEIELFLTNLVSDREAMFLQSNYQRQKKENKCHGD
ncbi:unnamed protein product [Brugia pahangi]|uniref:Uncharacterized protein n=1 Tax=Brugia pahangi TaxID=6280 RepID=A0A0N4SWW2_BRUPA|nr:unnamed protein product [Brugia pahangi]